MDFGFDEDQLALRESADKVLAAECGPAVVRAALDDPDAWRPLWDTIVGLGWTAIVVPEAQGGLGLGAVDLVALAEVTGRWALPVPFLSTAGFAAPVLALVGAGDVVAAGAVAALVPGPGSLVSDGPRADVFAVLTGGGVAVVPRADAEVRPTHAADPGRPLALVEAAGDAIPVDADALERALDVARTAQAAELVGVADRLLALAVEHARARQQFDRPIGAFQGVKHRLADLFVAVERARTLTYDAAMLIDDGTTPVSTRARTVALAKAAASEAAVSAGKTGVQVHGAIGITWEHDVQLFARRARQGALTLGDHVEHYRRAATLYLAEVD